MHRVLNNPQHQEGSNDIVMYYSSELSPVPAQSVVTLPQSVRIVLYPYTVYLYTTKKWEKFNTK